VKVYAFKINHNNKIKGFTLIEVLISVAIFAILAFAIYGGFAKMLEVISLIRNREIVTNLANEQFEIARNLPYVDVGTVGGIPAGVITENQTIVRDEKTFLVETTIRNIDDPFDGLLGGTPNDPSPADRKIVSLIISCALCKNIKPTEFTTYVSPKNLETASTKGALVIRVFDAAGLPVSDADVTIVNSSVSPAVNLTDQTNLSGMLTLVDAPPSVGGYKITVTKSGYSTDQTYPVGASGNPNPSKPNATVILQQITQLSFEIDKVSSVPVTTINNQCGAISGFDFDFVGTKLIGTSPNKIKHSNSFVTDGSGAVSINNVEWDTYGITGTDTTYDIIGTNPLLSLGVPPNTTQNMQIITAPKNGRRLVVVVKDQSTGLPVSDASVVLSKTGYTSTLTTNEGFINQTDWSLGSGQSQVGDTSKYLSSDGNIDISTSAGNISLIQNSGTYVSSGNLTSSTFDLGAVSNFKQILWSPSVQPVQTGATSVKFRIATNNDNTTWNFKGPDGTTSTYYTTTDQNINSAHNGDRYLRYKIYLSTANTAYTPQVSDISVTYSSGCIPPGQVSFSGLSQATYDLTVSKTGYQPLSKTVNINSSWQKEEIIIAP
jgi:prepilin-type N-terminal cleavage/methylation domain-containing protein